MQFSQNELMAQKAKVSDMQGSISREIQRVQETIALVEQAKAKIGEMQVNLLVEQRILERMEEPSASEE